MIDIIKEEEFRSDSSVNMSNNMIRATITCNINEWKHLKRILKFYSKHIYKIEVKYE